MAGLENGPAQEREELRIIGSRMKRHEASAGSQFPWGRAVTPRHLLGLQRFQDLAVAPTVLRPERKGRRLRVAVVGNHHATLITPRERPDDRVELPAAQRKTRRSPVALTLFPVSEMRIIPTCQGAAGIMQKTICYSHVVVSRCPSSVASQHAAHVPLDEIGFVPLIPRDLLRRGWRPVGEPNNGSCAICQCRTRLPENLGPSGYFRQGSQLIFRVSVRKYLGNFWRAWNEQAAFW